MCGLARLALSSRIRTRAELEQRFAGTVRPFMQSYCVACHGKEKPQAQLDLTAYASMASVARDYPHWSLVLEKLAAKQMPPPSVGKQPSAKQREAVIAWIRAVRQYEAQRNAGDPGPVLARRLSNAEYDYTIRDLTGVDLRPTREFPVDPANQEGFDNSGESLTLSPALMKKYVQAAKEIADHMVLTSTGPGVCVASGAGRDGPRQILHPAHRGFLQAAADGLRGLLPGRMAVSLSGRARRSRRHPADCRRRSEGKPALPGTGVEYAHRPRRESGPDCQTADDVECAARPG